jgi:hypothetical protein
MASQERRYVSPTKPGTSADPAWLRRQQRFFTAYVNSKLNKRDETVNDLFEDLKDGRVLKAFVEEISGTTIPGKQTSGNTIIQHVANLTPTFAFIKSTTKIVGIGPQDVADGNPGLVLGLLWSLIVFFASRDLGANQTKDLKKTLLDWVQKRCARRVNVEDLGASMADGRAFLALLEDEGFAYEPSEDASDNLRRAFDRAEQTYGAPRLLDASDPDFYREDKAVVAYLAELVKRLPERKVTGREAVEAVDACFASGIVADCARDLDGVLATLSSTKGWLGGLLTQKVPSVALIVDESNASVAVAVARGQREASERSCDLHVVVVRKGDDVTTLLKERFNDKPPDYVLVDAPGCTTVRGAALCFAAPGACAVDVSTRLTKVERGVDSAEVDMLDANRVLCACLRSATAVSLPGTADAEAEEAAEAAGAADLLKSRARVAALASTDAVAGTFPCTSSIASLSVRVAPGVSAEAASSMVGDALRSCAVVDFGAEAEVFATSATDGFCSAPGLDFAGRFRAACAAEAPDSVIVAPTVAARSVPAAAAAYRTLGAATFALSLRSANDAASLQASARVLARLVSGEALPPAAVEAAE